MTLTRRLFLGALGTLPMARLAAGAAAHRLTILHMNDFHSRHEAVDGAALTCLAGKPGCFGGAAHLASAIAIQRAAAETDGRTVLLVDAGDQFQGSLFFTAWKGEVELAVMHALGTEAMAIGNHEFDDGPATLAAFIRAARFPVISANVDAGADAYLAGLIRPHAMLNKAGLAIGLVGLTTQEAATGSSPGRNVRFDPPRPALQAACTELRAQGARLVVALSHLGVAADHGLAGTIAGLDVIVGGHSHTLLSDTEAGAAGPAHAAVAGPAGKTVVVQAACYGRYLGRLDLDIAADGSVLAYGGDTSHVGLDLPDEPKVAAIVASYAARLDSVRRRVVGNLPAPLGVEGCRMGECAAGNLVAEAMLASVHGADAALMNAGGIRTGLPGGVVTLGDVLVMLPFGNAVSHLKLRGSDLLAALANGLSRAGAGAFPQVAGLRVVWNPLAAPAARLVSAAIRQPDGGFAAVDPDRVYLVVTNNFLRSGGDGYAMLRDHAEDAYDSGPGLDSVVAGAVGTMAAVTDGRIAVGAR